MATAIQERSYTTPREKFPAAPPPVQAPPDRSLSLDAYRGFVMLAMISSSMGLAKLVNDPTWGWLAFQFDHVPWEGCTFWDLIQPSFMFIVGAAMPFAFAKRQQRGESWEQQLLHAARRSLLLIAIGIFLDVYGQGYFAIQFIRVLQQIAIGYFLAFFVIHLGPRVQAAAAVLLLAVHTLAFLLWGWAVGVNPWFEGANVGFAVDYVLGLPLSKGGYVTINAISSAATILFGVLAGELLRNNRSMQHKLAVLVLAGVAGLALGWVLSPWVPLVKRIWTASFAVFAAGWTCLMLAAFFAVVDGLQWRRWTFPLIVAGMNSIALYVSAQIFSGNIRTALRGFLSISADASQMPPMSVVFAVVVVLGQWLFCYWLYRHKIFFKV
jgi:heparan-alpha-glucosaminide N-acetyltransferase